MSHTAKLFTVLAAGFAIWGDYYLKRYGDLRSTWSLVACLSLWEVCAMMWVFVYRQHVPLGASTVYGQAIVVSANVLVGYLVFSEQMRPQQWLGACFVLLGIVLVG